MASHCGGFFMNFLALLKRCRPEADSRSGRGLPWKPYRGPCSGEPGMPDILTEADEYRRVLVR